MGIFGRCLGKNSEAADDHNIIVAKKQSAVSSQFNGQYYNTISDINIKGQTLAINSLYQIPNKPNSILKRFWLWLTKCCRTDKYSDNNSAYDSYNIILDSPTTIKKKNAGLFSSNNLILTDSNSDPNLGNNQIQRELHTFGHGASKKDSSNDDSEQQNVQKQSKASNNFLVHFYRYIANLFEKKPNNKSNNTQDILPQTIKSNDRKSLSINTKLFTRHTGQKQSENAIKNNDNKKQSPEFKIQDNSDSNSNSLSVDRKVSDNTYKTTGAKSNIQEAADRQKIRLKQGAQKIGIELHKLKEMNPDKLQQQKSSAEDCMVNTEGQNLQNVFIPSHDKNKHQQNLHIDKRYLKHSF